MEMSLKDENIIVDVIFYNEITGKKFNVMSFGGLRIKV